MAQLSRGVVTLRVMGEDLLPDEVSRMLGAQPSMAYARGDEIPVKRGATRVARFGFWSCAGADTEPADVDAQVVSLLEQLTPDLDVWHELADQFQLDLFCGWFMRHLNEGVVISPTTLMAIAGRGIMLDLDIYASGGEASES